MNQKEFFKKIVSLGLPVNSFYILGEGALILYGVKKEISDIELCISPILFEWLKKERRITEDLKDKKGFYKLLDSPDVRVVVNKKETFKYVTMGGDLQLEDIRQILEYKKKRNLKKDKKDIAEIEKFLQNHINLYDL